MFILHRKEKESPLHTTLRLWVNHGLAGTVILRNEEVDEFIKQLGSVDADEYAAKG